MKSIVVDPVGEKLYYLDKKAIQVINVNGSTRTQLHPHIGAYGMDVDLKKG